MKISCGLHNICDPVCLHLHQMDLVLQNLRQIGLNLKRSWVSLQEYDSTDNIKERLYYSALKSNLTLVSEGLLRSVISSATSYVINGPIILQIVNSTNVSNPRDSQFEDTTNRVLKLQLTDGVTMCYAIEFTKISTLSSTLKPGSKLSIANVRVENGLLLLNSTNTIVLGGSVPFSICSTNKI